MTSIALIFATMTQTFNLPPGLLSAVCFVESRHVVSAINYDDGGSSSFGLCQIKLSTARALGFRDTAAQLQINPRTNVYYAAKYMRLQLDRYGGNVYKAISAYNAGTHRINRKGITYNYFYVDKVLDAWANAR